MRGAGMDFQDFFVCILNFRPPAHRGLRPGGTKLKIPNRFAKGKGQWSVVRMGKNRGRKADVRKQRPVGEVWREKLII